LKPDFELIAPTYDTFDLRSSFEQLSKLIKEERETHWGEIVLVGSSLGGWMAEALGQVVGCTTLLLNPVRSLERMEQFIGPQTNFLTYEKRELTRQHFNENIRFSAEIENYLHGDLEWPMACMVWEGDTVLDSFKTAKELKDRMSVTLLRDGEHRVTDFQTVAGKIRELNNTVVC
jgi:predicted esterase YcpF (UPF0227 family)